MAVVPTLVMLPPPVAAAVEVAVCPLRCLTCRFTVMVVVVAVRVATTPTTPRTPPTTPQWLQNALVCPAAPSLRPAVAVVVVVVVAA